MRFLTMLPQLTRRLVPRLAKILEKPNSVPEWKFSTSVHHVRKCRQYCTSPRQFSENVETDKLSTVVENPTLNNHVDGSISRIFPDIPLSSKEVDLRLLQDPDQPENPQVLRVSIIGAPNAGKSTLTNKLLGWRVSSTSSKVHTTRTKINAVLTENEKQIVFLDTPGITTPIKTKRHNLERSLLTDPHSSFNNADLVGVVVDISVPWGRDSLDKEILKALLLHQDKKSILILNKIDGLKTRQILLPTTRTLTNGKVGGRRDSKVLKQEIVEPTSAHMMLNKLTKKDFLASSESETEIENLPDSSDKKGFHSYYSQLRRLSKVVENQKGFSNFDQVFMISALDGEGVKELRDYFLSQTLPGDWLYHSSTVTDQDPLTIAQQCVWEKLMDHLPQEVPYNINIEITKFQEDEYGVLRIAMDLNCYTQYQLRQLLGKGGQRIKLISSQAKQELMNAFRRDLTLMLAANLRGETKKKWWWRKKKKASDLDLAV